MQTENSIFSKGGISMTKRQPQTPQWKYIKFSNFSFRFRASTACSIVQYAQGKKKTLSCKKRTPLMLFAGADSTWNCFTIKLLFKRKINCIFIILDAPHETEKVFHKKHLKSKQWKKRGRRVVRSYPLHVPKNYIVRSSVGWSWKWQNFSLPRRNRAERMANNNRTLIILDLIACILCSAFFESKIEREIEREKLFFPSR